VQAGTARKVQSVAAWWGMGEGTRGISSDKALRRRASEPYAEDAAWDPCCKHDQFLGMMGSVIPEGR